MSSFLAVPEAAARDQTLKLYFPHTGERGTFTFKRNGKYDRGELKKINRFLRDWRRNATTDMDPKLLDLVWEVYRLSGAKDVPVTIISAYRSPATNEKLRKRSRGVAKNSQHTHGRAMDFFIPGVPLSKLREIGLKMQIGGVGYYPTSGSPFVHLDTGSVRHWPRMTRKQLMAVFPTGETVHVPTDGKPLPGYKLAKVKVDKTRRNGTVVAYLDPDARSIVPARPKRAPERPADELRLASVSASPKDDGDKSGTRKWLSRVFDGEGDEDEEGESDVAVVASLPDGPPGGPMDLMDAPATQVAEAPVPRERPGSGTEEPAPIVVAALEGVPRPRPNSTPFDITPQERAQIAELAATPPVGGRAGSRRTDDALAGLYATASYDPGDEAVLRARAQLARMAAAEARSRDAAPAEQEPSAAADDALAGLFATADRDEPPVVTASVSADQLGRATVTRAQKGDMGDPPALVAPRQGSALAAARQTGHSVFRARDDESPLARASRERTLVEAEPRTALAAATSFGRPDISPTERERARESLIRMAYADTGRAEPAATGSVLAEARPRLVPQVAPVDTDRPLVAAGTADDIAPAPQLVYDGPVPLPRARPGGEPSAPPTIVASLPRHAIDQTGAATRPIREVPIVEAPAQSATMTTGDGVRFSPPSHNDADLLTATIEREADDADGYPWSDGSDKVANLAERMMVGDTQFQARDFAELRRPRASDMGSLFAPVPESRPAVGDAEADDGWQTQTASLDTTSFQPVPRPGSDAPTPHARPGRVTTTAAAGSREAPGVLKRWIRTARSILP